MSNCEFARQLLSKQSKVHLGFFPTPLCKLEQVSLETGVNVYIKRDDFSGKSLFGGNKIRKLEYLMGDAKKKGCDTVITYGATQSNHAMETATAARQCGIQPILYLAAVVKPDADVRANLLLDMILGAEIHIIDCLPGEDGDTALGRHRHLVEQRILEIEKKGHVIYEIPGGGTTEIGVIGYIEAYVELMAQMKEIGVKPDYLFAATGTGGTIAGLSAGKALIESDCKLVAIQVSPKTTDYPEHITRMGNAALKCMGAGDVIITQPVVIDPAYFSPGYELPNQEANADIKYLARTEGIFTDPVYTGKSFHAMMDYIRNGKIPKGSNVIFLHTGGATALFSETEITGDLNTI